MPPAPVVVNLKWTNKYASHSKPGEMKWLTPTALLFAFLFSSLIQTTKSWGSACDHAEHLWLPSKFWLKMVKVHELWGAVTWAEMTKKTVVVNFMIAFLLLTLRCNGWQKMARCLYLCWSHRTPLLMDLRSHFHWDIVVQSILGLPVSHRFVLWIQDKIFFLCCFTSHTNENLEENAGNLAP